MAPRDAVSVERATLRDAVSVERVTMFPRLRTKWSYESLPALATRTGRKKPALLLLNVAGLRVLERTSGVSTKPRSVTDRSVRKGRAPH